MITACLGAILGALPCEYVIDCGPNRVPVTSSMTIELRARDGTTLEVGTIEISKDAEPDTVFDFLIYYLREDEAGWQWRRGPGATLVVSGTKKSMIQSVRIKSDAWKPEVRWVPLPPKK